MKYLLGYGTAYHEVRLVQLTEEDYNLIILTLEKYLMNYHQPLMAQNVRDVLKKLKEIE